MSSKLWTVELAGKAKKQLRKIEKEHKDIFAIYQFFERDLMMNGPTLNTWPNYTKEKGRGKGIDKRHCHLKKGKPTWVACYEIVDKEIKLLEVYYVGTHEKAPY